MSIRVVLADDHPGYRDYLRSLLERKLEMDVVAEAADGVAACEAVARQRPDVVILDVAMPVVNGIEAAKRISAADPAVKIVALSLHSEPGLVSAMLAAGSVAYVLKDDPFSELLYAIREVLAGRTYLSLRLEKTESDSPRSPRS